MLKILTELCVKDLSNRAELCLRSMYNWQARVELEWISDPLINLSNKYTDVRVLLILKIRHDIGRRNLQFKFNYIDPRKLSLIWSHFLTPKLSQIHEFCIFWKLVLYLLRTWKCWSVCNMTISTNKMKCRTIALNHF